MHRDTRRQPAKRSRAHATRVISPRWHIAALRRQVRIVQAVSCAAGFALVASHARAQSAGDTVQAISLDATTIHQLRCYLLGSELPAQIGFTRGGAPLLVVNGRISGRLPSGDITCGSSSLPPTVRDIELLRPSDWVREYGDDGHDGIVRITYSANRNQPSRIESPR